MRRVNIAALAAQSQWAIQFTLTFCPMGSPLFAFTFKPRNYVLLDKVHELVQTFNYSSSFHDDHIRFK